MKAIPLKKRQLIYGKYKGRCSYCGDRIKYKDMHVDHIIPLYRKWTNEDLAKYGKKKGTSKMDNLTPSCATCNISKSTFTIEEWRERILLKVNMLRRDSSNFRILEKYRVVKIVFANVKFHFETVK